MQKYADKNKIYIEKGDAESDRTMQQFSPWSFLDFVGLLRASFAKFPKYHHTNF